MASEHVVVVRNADFKQLSLGFVKIIVGYVEVEETIDGLHYLL
jgi:hypothetical protein